MADAGVGEAAVAEGGKTAGEAAAGETAAAYGGEAAAGGVAEDVGVMGATAGSGAGAGFAAEGGIAADAGVMGGTAASGAGGGYSGVTGLEAASAADGAGGFGAWLSNMGQGMKSILPSLQGAKGGLGVAQILSGLYSFDQSRKLSQSMRPPNPADLTKMPGYQAGLQAVMRSMASQGYQGSGNMMAALSKYGGDAYSQMWQGNIASGQAGMGGLNAQLSSLGLLTAGAGNLAGWGGNTGGGG